jgi:glycosyltransferase involved in cell wall biosynthesis
VKLCFVGDPRSIHTQRWVRWFADDNEVVFVATAHDEALSHLAVSRLPSGSHIPGMRLAASVRTLRRVIADQKPDIVHAHFINEAGWFVAAARKRPFVITAWGSDLYRAPAESRLARRLNPWAVRAADHVTCDSQDQARLLRDWGVAPDRVSVIGWGVDRREFHPGVDGSAIRKRLDIPAEAPVVLSPRQWLPNSNVESIIAAHAQLSEDAILLLKRLSRFEANAGARVQAAIEASPARARIRVLDEIDAADLPALYAAADVVVSLASTDGTPVSVLEAMAVGRPVVALANASVAEWVTPPGGTLVASLGTEDIAAAIRTSLAAPAEAAERNITIVTERADRATEMARMTEIYRRLA